MMVDETVWEDVETCDHSYDRRCHKSFTTTYTAVQVSSRDCSECLNILTTILWLLVQEEECDEVFRKICYIEMVDIATNVTQQVNTEL